MNLENPMYETLGTHLFPSVADKEYHMGHMWIYWTNENNPPPSRGYWPLLDAIPKKLRNPEAVRNFLISDAIPGRYMDESTNAELTDSMRSQARERRWTINAAQKMLLEREYRIPLEDDGVTQGLYSCNEKREDCNNCCSWALKVLYGATKNPDFLKCLRPKRLRYVELALWES